MLFQARFLPGIRDGSITLTFRAWASARVGKGRRYRLGPDDAVEVTGVAATTRERITARQAREAGFAEREELLALLERAGGDRTIYRVRFRHVRDADPRRARRADTSAAALDEVAARLARMDARAARGPWTREVLTLIAKHPRTAASKLAPRLDRETRAFKADVRKLKELGLTVSHETGYSLSPRGRALLEKDR